MMLRHIPVLAALAILTSSCASKPPEPVQLPTMQKMLSIPGRAASEQSVQMLPQVMPLQPAAAQNEYANIANQAYEASGPVLQTPAMKAESATSPLPSAAMTMASPSINADMATLAKEASLVPSAMQAPMVAPVEKAVPAQKVMPIVTPAKSVSGPATLLPPGSKAAPASAAMPPPALVPPKNMQSPAVGNTARSQPAKPEQSAKPDDPAMSLDAELEMLRKLLDENKISQRDYWARRGALIEAKH